MRRWDGMEGSRVVVVSPLAAGFLWLALLPSSGGSG